MGLTLGWAAAPTPDQARVHVEDVERFYAVFETRDEPGFVRRLRRDYLKAGSPGLQKFRPRIGSARQLAREVQLSEMYYAQLQAELARVPDMEASFQAVFNELEARYPDGVYPDVYVLVGRFLSGGTVADEGLLIGGELYGLTDQTDLDEVPGFIASSIKPVSELDAIVAHDLIHYQQKYGQGDRLAQVLTEGSADYVGEVLAGRHINAELHAHGRQHDEDVKQRFCPTRHAEGAGAWLYRMGTVDGVPKDLGYYVG